MRNAPIATVVNFCTNEERFLKACLTQASLFSKQILVPVCDHFFDGRPENLPLLQSIYSAFPQVHFLQYPFLEDPLSRRRMSSTSLAHFWHNLSRFLAAQFLDPEIEWVLFLDADEIAEGHRFSRWIKEGVEPECSALKFSNYWYFREPCYQALSYEDSVLLIRKEELRSALLLHEKERDALYEGAKGGKRRHVMGIDDRPLFHHYSWVRTQEEMLQKVVSWGHRSDRPWTELVEREFSRPFSGKDFIHGYVYQTVKPAFSLDKEAFVASGQPNLTILSQEEVLSLLPGSPSLGSFFTRFLSGVRHFLKGTSR